MQLSFGTIAGAVLLTVASAGLAAFAFTTPGGGVTPAAAQTAAGATAPATFTDAQKAAIEGIVRAYLLENPELMVEVFAELEKKEAQRKAESGSAAIAENRDALFNNAADHVAGNPQGDVTIVEFFDYRCPFCRKARTELMAALAADPNVRLVLKEFPILGPVSREASLAALASRKQGDRYWDYHEKMLSETALDSEKIFSIARDLGLDVARLKADMQDPAIEAQLAETRRLAEALGIDGTPGFVIGNAAQSGALSKDEFLERIAAARAAQ